jgi:hypothetical protein
MAGLRVEVKPKICSLVQSDFDHIVHGKVLHIDSQIKSNVEESWKVTPSVLSA